MTRYGHRARLQRLEGAIPGGIPEDARTDLERGLFAITVCAIWCLSRREMDALYSMLQADPEDDRCWQMIDSARPRLLKHFDDLTPPEGLPRALRAWADEWEERKNYWGPDPSETEEDHTT